MALFNILFLEFSFYWTFGFILSLDGWLHLLIYIHVFLIDHGFPIVFSFEMFI